MWGKTYCVHLCWSGEQWHPCCSAMHSTQAVPEMFHPPKIPEPQQYSNRTGLQLVPVANLLNADVVLVADPFFQPLLAVVGRCWICNGVIDLLSLGLNLFNYNSFGTGGPFQPVGHPLQ